MTQSPLRPLARYQPAVLGPRTAGSRYSRFPRQVDAGIDQQAEQRCVAKVAAAETGNKGCGEELISTLMRPFCAEQPE